MLSQILLIPPYPYPQFIILEKYHLFFFFGPLPKKRENFNQRIAVKETLCPSGKKKKR